MFYSLYELTQFDHLVLSGFPSTFYCHQSITDPTLDKLIFVFYCLNRGIMPILM